MEQQNNINQTPDKQEEEVKEYPFKEEGADDQIGIGSVYREDENSGESAKPGNEKDAANPFEASPEVQNEESEQEQLHKQAMTERD